MMLSPLYFVTGTDTDAGKTVATAQLLRALAAAGIKAAGMKPVASGCEWRDGMLWNSDVAAHAAASGIRVPAHLACPYLFEPAISPHLAAEEAGVTTDPELIVSAAKELQTLADVVLLEGAGGLVCAFNPPIYHGGSGSAFASAGDFGGGNAAGVFKSCHAERPGHYRQRFSAGRLDCQSD